MYTVLSLYQQLKQTTHFKNQRYENSKNKIRFY